ncbi:MAG: aminopeptidase P family N-terminal domain-containing protein, partial [Caldimicrobium sp.]
MNSPKKSKNYINELIYRWERVKNLLETLGIEAILITSAPNIFYLCGFKSSQ